MTVRLFAVRTFEGHEITGLFLAHNLEELWWQVDSVTDPCDCEYTPIDNSGWISWPNSGAKVVGEKQPDIDDDGNDASDGFFDGTQLDWEGSFHDALFPYAFDREKKWKRLPYADQPGGGLYGIFRDAGRLDELSDNGAANDR